MPPRLRGKCVLWKGPVNKSGYGVVYSDKKVINAHRLAYILIKGKIPKEHHIHHLCNNRLCVNVAHLQCLSKYKHLALPRPRKNRSVARMSLICEVCEQDDSIIKKQCPKCNRRYCVHNTGIDDGFCYNCMVDIQLDVKNLEARKAREIKLGGADLFFAEKFIRDTPDNILDLRIEYYGMVYHALMMEKQERKIKHLASLAKVKLVTKPTQAVAPSKAARAAKAAAKDPLATITAALTLVYGRVPTEQEVKAFMLMQGMGGIKN